MAKDLLLEIGCEEIPARFIDSFYSDLKSSFVAALKRERIAIDDENNSVWATNRRLSFLLTGVSECQRSEEKTILGPPLSIARKDETWLPPAHGFAKKCCVELSQLTTSKDDKGRDVLCVNQTLDSLNTNELLPKIIQTVLSEVYLPIAMRWANYDASFIRPIHWVLLLYGNDVIPVELFGVKSSNYTYGHRFLSEENSSSIMGKKLEISDISSYVKTLRDHFVIVDKMERRRRIEKALIAQGICLETESDLINEVVYLVEYPQPVIGTLDNSFLTLPKELLVETMKKNQKYFPIYKNDELSNQFLIIAENVTDKSKQQIITGNQTVLNARFNDALFFYKEDQKLPLSSFVPKLKKVTYKKNLGSLFDKKERIKALSLKMAKQLNLNIEEDLVAVSDLCKADLVSLMVYEFPDLQGVMGSYYSRKTEKIEVSEAILDHYKPTGSNANLPQSILGAVVGLADRLDDTVSAFYSNQLPSGSKDPLGVRRALFGIFNLLINFTYKGEHVFSSLDIQNLISESFQLFGESRNEDQLMTFYNARLKAYLLEYIFTDCDQDIIDAVISVNSLNPAYACLLIEKLNSLKSNSEFKQIVETAVRIKRLAAKAESSVFDASLFTSIEKETYDVYRQVLEEEFVSLEKLSAPFGSYFDQVLVIDKDEILKTNRLAFLSSVNKLYLAVADFEKIIV